MLSLFGSTIINRLSFDNLIDLSVGSVTDLPRQPLRPKTTPNYLPIIVLPSDPTRNQKHADNVDFPHLECVNCCLPRPHTLYTSRSVAYPETMLWGNTIVNSSMIFSYTMAFT